MEFDPPRTPGTTGIGAHLTCVLPSLIVITMLIHDRDRSIVLSIAMFRQLASGHIAALHFADVASPTPQWRAMKRLEAQGFVRRVERRPVGGTGAGSGQVVWQLGPAGHALSERPKGWFAYRSIDFHTLAIADAHVELLDAERRGRLTIEDFVTEPETHMMIAGADLRPDYYVEASDLIKRRTLTLWIEIDMGTEREKAIKDKLRQYWHAYQHATNLDPFPFIVFLAPDELRARRLRKIIEQGSEDAQRLFIVTTIPQFTGLLFG